MPSGCQTRRKIFEATSLSKVPKSPGLNLLSRAVWCWLKALSSLLENVTSPADSTVKPAFSAQQLKPSYFFLIWMSFQ